MRSHDVLVVDDSAIARALLTAIIDRDPHLRVAGEAADGAAAVELTKSLRPAIVVMDINMPGMDGIEATTQIMIEQPTPILIVTAGFDARQVEVSLKAVTAGALTVAPKPVGPADPSFGYDSARLVTLLKALADVKVVRQRSRNERAERAPSDALAESTRSIDIVGVAASTGGPAALYRFLEALPRTLDVPVLVVQHIAHGFVDGLGRWLCGATTLPVLVAADGAKPEGGHVYLAPDDRHLILERGRLKLSSAEPVGGFRPSATALFRSLAVSHREAAVAVVLTGMGNDGLDGATAIRDAGGLVLAQDAASSVVFGMPQAVVSAGVAHAVGPVEELAYRISRSVSKTGGWSKGGG